VALRTADLRVVKVDDATVALRLLVDGRDELGGARTLTVNRLHRLLADLIPGGPRRSCPRPRQKPCWRPCDPAAAPSRCRSVSACPLAGQTCSASGFVGWCKRSNPRTRCNLSRAGAGGRSAWSGNSL
jgi:transposase